MKQTTVNEIFIKYKHRKILGDQISHSAAAYSVVKKIYKQSGSNIQLKEYFFVVMLNRANKVIGYHKLSEGGIAGTVADLRLAFAAAIKCLACAIILVHNHPSGNLKPSKADIILTRKFRKAGDLLDIQVLDHLILTSNSYTSLSEEGHL